MTSTTAPTTRQAIPIHNHMREPVMKLPFRVPYPWKVQTAPAAINPMPMTTAIHRMSATEPACAPAGCELGLLGRRVHRRRDERAGRVSGGREEVHVDARDLVATELDV